MWSFGFDATTGATLWALIALFIFLGIVVYLGVHKRIAGHARRSHQEDRKRPC